MTNIEVLLSRLQGVKKQGKEWVAHCPAHSDSTPSLGVKLSDTGKILIHCMADCAPADILTSIGLELADLFPDRKMNGHVQPVPTAEPERITCAPPLGVNAPLLLHPAHGKPTMLHVYTTLENKLLGYVMRFDLATGKTFCPLTYSAADGWKYKAFSKPRPLYGLGRLRERPDGARFLVEGEKTADALQALVPKNAVLSWCGGAGAAKHADLAPLAGQAIILWPDADDAGRKAADEIAERLSSLRCSIRIVDTEGLSEGFDAADLKESLKPWLTPRLRDYVARAAPPPVPESHSTPEAPVDVPAALEKAKTDAGAILEPAVLGALQNMRRTNPAEYARIRSQVKAETETPVGELDRLTGPKASVTPITEARTLRQAKPDTDPDVLPSAYSHDALASAFTAQHPDWRHVAEWGKWLRWNGTYWERDTTLHVFNLARHVCRAFAEDAKVNNCAPSTVRSIVHANTITAVERLARADPAHARATEQWDADPWALNTPGGIVCLTDGTIRPGRPEDHATRITRATPHADAMCPTWAQFLIDATNGDGELIGFLQRMAGYCLTGSIRDHALFFIHGNGGNGKGTFLNTLTWILGDYAGVAAMDTFTEQKQPQHKTELASLMGRRLVSAQEVEEGKRWAEARINALTGGDPITANFMRQDLFTFMPQFKLVVVGNHKPLFRNVGDAIRRRLHLIPFTHKIDKPDTQLADKLRAEADGILRWAVAGCIEWQRIGLDPPQIVRLATGDYLASQDSIATWLTECCEVPASAESMRLHPASYWKSPLGPLFKSYQTWCDGNGEPNLGRKRFVEAMASRGFSAIEERKHYFLIGVRLAPADADSAPAHSSRFQD